MKPNEAFAIRQYLESYPENVSFEDVLQKLKTGSPDVNVWEPFEKLSSYDLANAISRLSHEIETQFFPIFELVTVIDKETVTGMLSQEVNRDPKEEEINAICSWLDTDFSCHLPERISDAVTFLSIPKNQ
jgi:uncharacterized protein YjaG (DUF416 family)